MKLFFSPCILAAVLPSFLSVIRRMPITLGLAVGLCNITAAQTDGIGVTTTIFSQPVQYCFDQAHLAACRTPHVTS